MARWTASKGTWTALAACMSMAIVGSADAAAVHLREALRPTAAAPTARGRAKLAMKNGARATFAIVARKLAPTTTYEVVVDGIKVGSLTTRPNGAGKVTFAAPKRGRARLMGFDPRGAAVAVRDHDGDDVLEGDMPDDASDPNAVACCIPDDDGVECKDRTPEECLDAGGEPSSATGCFPDPCADAEGVVCCLADSASGAFCDDGPEVECDPKRGPDACAAAGGTVVEAASCEDDPCAPVPPAELVVCCVPDDDEVECEIRTPDRCAKRGGTAVTAKSCEENPCGTPPDDDEDDHDDDEGGGGDD